MGLLCLQAVRRTDPEAANPLAADLQDHARLQRRRLGREDRGVEEEAGHRSVQAVRARMLRRSCGLSGERVWGTVLEAPQRVLAEDCPSAFVGLAHVVSWCELRSARASVRVKPR